MERVVYSEKRGRKLGVLQSRKGAGEGKGVGSTKQGKEEKEKEKNRRANLEERRSAITKQDSIRYAIVIWIIPSKFVFGENRISVLIFVQYEWIYSKN